MLTINIFKKIYIISLLLSTNVYSQNLSPCLLNNEFNGEFKITNNNLTINLKRKDDQPFRYYSKFGMTYGFKFLDNKKLNIENLNLGKPFVVSANEQDFYNKYYYYLTEDQQLVSSYFSSYRLVSQIDSLPSKNSEFKLVSQYKEEIDIDEYISYFKNLMSHNNIEGKHKIKFYVKLLLNMDLQCVYFESDTINYQFDINYIYKSLRTLKTIKRGFYD